MKCNNCGGEVGQSASFCPFCGAKIEQSTNYVNPEFSGTAVQTAGNNAFADFLLSKNKDGLFLALCILVSVSALAGLFSGTIPVFAVLYTIFFWIIFAKARSGKLDTDKMRCVSGTFYAKYIVNWVLVGIFGVCGGLLAILAPIAGSEILESSTVEKAFEKSNFSLSDYAWLKGVSVAVLLGVMAFVFILAAAVLTVVNLLGVKKIHRFLKSFYLSAQTGNVMLECVESAKVWMLVLGILKAVSALSSVKSFKDFVSTGSMAAAYIIGFVILKKYFVKAQ